MTTADRLDKILDQARHSMAAAAPAAEALAERRLCRVLDVYRDLGLAISDFAPTSGYGYNDAGRDKLEAAYAQIFGAEAALVRQQIVSGSHAITLALAGNLRPGDQLVCAGWPYDTLQTVMGLNRDVTGSLRQQGVDCRVAEMDFSSPDPAPLLAALTPRTRLVSIQRSRGYSLRPSLTVAQIQGLTQAVHEARPDIIVFVDDCYGEFVEDAEPVELGADVMAGSLIKNLGAGIAPGGGYIVGRSDLVEGAAARLTIPGAGRELGSSLIDNRLFFQSLLLAPQIVLEAKLGAVFAAAAVQGLGFAVSPLPEEYRADIVQCLYLVDSQRLLAFCRGIQKYSPVDSRAVPEPWPMPGYDNDIIMASGSFISGSSIELSADGPLREPYAIFFQGGLSRYHAIYAISRALGDMAAAGLV